MNDYPEFALTAGTVFPGTATSTEFVRSTRMLLEGRGFAPENTIASVAVCRDEIAGPLVGEVEAVWGRSFSLAGLAGLVNAGQTGFRAAAHHSPIVDGRRHMVVYALAHIGIGRSGAVGEVLRTGIRRPSTACGALVAFHTELVAGTASPAFDPHDVEQSLLRARLLPLLDEAAAPSLVDLTHLAIGSAEEDLLAALHQLVDSEPDPIDAALVTGIQIHGPDGIELVWPRSAHIVTSEGVKALPL